MDRSMFFYPSKMEEEAKKYWAKKPEIDAYWAKIGCEPKPFDARFPNTKQNARCWANYIDYHRCIHYKGEDYELCQYFKKWYKRLCFRQHYELWDWYMKKGVLPGRIE